MKINVSIFITAVLLTAVSAQEDTEETALDRCYDNQCKDFQQDYNNCHDQAENDEVKFFTCACPKMTDTLANNGDCSDCLLNAGYNLTAQAGVYCDAFGVFNPTQASSWSEASTASTASSSPSSSSSSNNDDDDSSATSIGVTTTAAAGVMLAAIGCLF
ncbi:hypothetical protein E3Q00_03419 [Wallemia mellicola]|nr:hypothetical protein E3Q00_03419 [Wallemia mellicola]